MRIVLYEDGSRLTDELCRTLRRHGHAVQLASANAENVRVPPGRDCDLVILDLSLRGAEAATLVGALGQRRDDVPTLVLTAREQLQERVQALELGADCLAEPIAMPELSARVRALMRRSRPRLAGRLTCGPLVLDRDARRAYLCGEPLSLLPREWAVAELLLGRPEQIVPKDAFMRSLSANGKPVSANTIETHISRLRGKLDGAGIRIRTVHRVGYMLEAPVAETVSA